jgi:hypothetical protein
MAATPLAPGDIMKVQIVSTLAGQTAINTFHYLVTAVGGTPGTDQDVVDQFNTNNATPFKQIIPSEVTYKGILGGIITRIPNPVTVQNVSSQGAGVTAVEPMPKQACGITSWYTASAGKKYRGRTYWPFISSSYQDVNGEISAAGQAAMDAVASNIIGMAVVAIGGRSVTVQAVIYHRVSKTGTPIVVRVTRTKVATQKRRGDYGHLNASPL